MTDNDGLNRMLVHAWLKLGNVLFAAIATAFLIFSYGATRAVGGQEASLSHKAALPLTKDSRVKWGRDPFLQAGATATPHDMRLTAIFYNAESPSAIINGRIVYKDSEVSGQKVIDIGRRHVILQTSAGKIRLDIAGATESLDAAK
ncbi:MAG: hypothetical protein HY886_07720 [Deltaproteobacteria bacterium]|nr:hypothetical protein [Deltaproteobacteria bacterium]